MLNESNVNYYAKAFPAVFTVAKGEIVTDTTGKDYIDFFCGAGTMNYGHNNPALKAAVHSFLDNDHILHCLDMDSKMKELFLTAFQETILEPRGLDYKVQFPGPTGTNAVEAAVKLARLVTKRKKIIAFTQSFHGMTSMSMSLSGCREEQHPGNTLHDVTFFPFDQFGDGAFDTLRYLEAMIKTSGSGVTLPAAIILETIQAEGGVNIAGVAWLKALRAFTAENGILLIVDDIQVGCGRTGSFFSFERAGIIPDIVLLSKSISGFGLPLSVILMKPSLDHWKPGEHNGTFRANNLSLCTAHAALHYWKDDGLLNEIKEKEEMIGLTLTQLVTQCEAVKGVRGMGMIWGVEFRSGSEARAVASGLFRDGLLIEACGMDDQVLKILPPLTISKDNLRTGLAMMERRIREPEYAGATRLMNETAS
ncbi:diaminobutyrate aminotransferase apoenzyme [Chitinophaga eiseniae]|uniref:Diaminobutyrate--2-oxoglutarate transaminase n=1 Tax=Chitinophaga eiseniae TaxID=634771 RepID=A0A1T4U6P8_9BACT|nr:diaminobutyrate--2-oxoglutarate transaminase [Chitinophaga eiseniae]SKA48316.1 diaminobutyrate aminotransferase apoenzyme [Chitinophaga eiseniae]